MNIVPAAAGAVSALPEPAKTAKAAKAEHAGMEFEAVLLNTVLGSLERSFSHLPGGKEDHATEGYSGLAMQALTSGLARSGGIGLGRLIAKELLKNPNQDHTVPKDEIVTSGRSAPLKDF